ncbi:hypothetical protein WICANDRAFT_63360 [Wickerhamomyces anomalus NRRL Y-366-8]|uniref:Uncharacterized protein n=1 Tax=Wickerhamomyces anomalus (strain ATCC 58044 / CBS 1984 / NCYC 433 / NRRL Y-366-8) TaxID=683960 RepID=A0A1E3P0W9_WICAA|nr:uncharacterized protein WICANDRAFT_63360 [Wickerhamomyces anomalus NRRL Y-366-8]ODQ58854.1 hypothetical protein WICANDRAFT_63360 [Wickerhamomyces anomalus NRRL Y-366-8]
MQFTTIFASVFAIASVSAIPMAQIVTQTQVEYITVTGSSQVAAPTGGSAGVGNATAPETTLSGVNSTLV